MLYSHPKPDKAAQENIFAKSTPSEGNVIFILKPTVRAAIFLGFHRVESELINVKGQFCEVKVANCMEFVAQIEKFSKRISMAYVQVITNEIEQNRIPLMLKCSRYR